MEQLFHNITAAPLPSPPALPRFVPFPWLQQEYLDGGYG